MIWDNIISLDMYNLLGKILLFLNKNAEAIFRQTLMSLQAVLGTSTHPLSCLSVRGQLVLNQTLLFIISDQTEVV